MAEMPSFSLSLLLPMRATIGHDTAVFLFEGLSSGLFWELFPLARLGVASSLLVLFIHCDKTKYEEPMTSSLLP